MVRVTGSLGDSSGLCAQPARDATNTSAAATRNMIFFIKDLLGGFSTKDSAAGHNCVCLSKKAHILIFYLSI